MNFSSFLYQLILSSMILPTVALFVEAIVFPKDPVYLVAVVLGYAIAMLTHENILTFFTIQKVFITRVITITLLCGGFLAFAEATIPGVKIEDIDALTKEFGSMVISDIDVSKYVTMLLISLVSGLIFFILKELKKKI